MPGASSPGAIEHGGIKISSAPVAPKRASPQAAAAVGAIAMRVFGRRDAEAAIARLRPPNRCAQPAMSSSTSSGGSGRGERGEALHHSAGPEGQPARRSAWRSGGILACESRCMAEQDADPAALLGRQGQLVGPSGGCGYGVTFRYHGHTAPVGLFLAALASIIIVSLGGTGSAPGPLLASEPGAYQQGVVLTHNIGASGAEAVSNRTAKAIWAAVPTGARTSCTPLPPRAGDSKMGWLDCAPENVRWTKRKTAPESRREPPRLSKKNPASLWSRALVR